MSKVTVYKVKVYDITKDESVVSRRMATEEGAKMMCGEILPHTKVEIDKFHLVHGEQWTDRDFVA